MPQIIFLSYFILLYPTCQYYVAFLCIIIAGDTMKPLKEIISITIDGDVLEKIRAAAENDDRSLSQYINLVLKNHCKKLEDSGAKRD